MQILVTGGSGYLGTHVRKFLGADDLSRSAGPNVLNLEDVARVADYDMVIHLAAEMDKRPENAGQVFLTNVEGTVNVLREMRPGSVFIFASTRDVYGRFVAGFEAVNESCPTNFAGQTALEWSKLIAERYVEYYANARGFRSCIFRLSTVYAPQTEGRVPSFPGHYADAINTGELLRLPGGGRPVRDLLHVDDFSRACSAFAESIIKHGLYNLGGGPANALSLTGLVERLEEISGLQAVTDHENPLPDPVPLNYVTDLTLVTHELGWRPEVDLNEGLKTLF